MTQRHPPGPIAAGTADRGGRVDRSIWSGFAGGFLMTRRTARRSPGSTGRRSRQARGFAMRRAMAYGVGSTADRSVCRHPTPCGDPGGMNPLRVWGGKHSRTAGSRGIVPTRPRYGPQRGVFGTRLGAPLRVGPVVDPDGRGQISSGRPDLPGRRIRYVYGLSGGGFFDHACWTSPDPDVPGWGRIVR